jgi:hypothetical protein
MSVFIAVAYGLICVYTSQKWLLQCCDVGMMLFQKFSDIDPDIGLDIDHDIDGY